MLINVEDPVRNHVLNACFYSIYLLTLVSIVPWRGLVGRAISQAAWLQAGGASSSRAACPISDED